MNSYFHVDGQWVDQLVNNTFFLTNGYFQAKSIIADNECDKLRGLFESDIKSSKIRMLRQRSVLYEPHRFSCNGYVENALLDVHRHDVLPHTCFVEMVNDLLNSASLSQCLESILGTHSVLVQSMYFESSRGTIPHFDKFFLGVENNNMVGVWVALEDIDPSSGRFFIYTDSHNLNFEGSDNQDELVELLEEYKRLNTVAIHGHQKTSRKHHVRTIIDSKKVLNEIIDLAGWEKKYFSMQKGDVLFFFVINFTWQRYTRKNTYIKEFIDCAFCRRAA